MEKKVAKKLRKEEDGASRKGGGKMKKVVFKCKCKTVSVVVL